MRAIYLLGAVLIAIVTGLAVGYFMPRPVSPQPTMSLSAASVPAGTEYTVSLSGFPANIEVYGWVVNENPPRSFLVGTTNAHGELSVTGEAPQTTGTWPLVACDEDYEYWAMAVLTVT